MESCLGEESFQMWGLNRRLEAYLARVKALEEQNELLSAELVGLRARSGDASWRARAEDELAALRALVDQRWREKHEAEVARDSLEEEAQSVAGRCQQQRLARERTAEEAARSRRAAEAERCSQAWLSRRAAGLERELEALRAAHEQERADLAAPAVGAPRLVRPPRGPPAPGPDVEELALRMGEAWRGAVRGYQERVARMETALDQARQRLGRVVQGAREGRLELQQLQAERGGLQERRAALEQRLEGRWQERLQATEKFQLAVGALEQEKQGLQSQIAQILEGRQQLAHLKMSLSLEVATYRTLLEAENSRLQTPGGGSKVSFSFQDPKLELHFPGTPEGRRPGPLLSVLSPTPLPSPLPDSLEIPVPTFLKSQETVQARTPTLASTPIPLTHQAPFPATDGETGAQDGPLSVLHPQAGRQRVAQAIPASTLPGPEEPGGQQPEAGTGQPPEDPASLAPPLSPDHPSLEAKDGEPSESGVCGRFQEEGEGQAWELAERAAAMEVKVASSLQQETQEEHLDGKGIQDAQCLLEKATLESLEEDIQEPLMSLEHRSQEPPRSPEKGAPELLEPLEEQEMEIGGTLEKETRELLEPIGKEDTQTLPPLEQENQVLRGSLEDDLEAFLHPGKEGPELVRSLDEEDSVSLAALEKQNQEPLRALEGEDQETMRPLEKENQEPLRPLEDENQVVRGPVEKEIEQPLRPLGQDQTTVRPPGGLKPEPPGSPGKDREILGPLEKGNQELLRSFREGSVEAVRRSESESLGPLRSAGEELEALKSIAAQEPLWPLGDVNQETTKPLEKEVQEPLGSVEENQESLRSLGEWNPEQLRCAEEVDKESPRDRGEEESPEEGGNQETPPRPLEEQGQELLLSAGPQRREEVAAEDQERDPEMPLGRAGVDEEGAAELGLREHGGLAGEEEGELPPTAPGPAWSAGEGRPGSPEPKEQRVPAEGASGEGDVEGLQDPEGQPEQVGDPGLQAPWGMSEAPEQVLEGEAEAPGGGRAAPEVTLGLEAAMDECEAGDERGPEEEAAELEDPGHLDTEQVLLGGPLPGEEGWKAQGVQGLEGPRQDLEEAAALEPELPMQSGAPLELPGAGEELEPEDPWGAAAASPAETLCQEGSDAPPPRPQGSEGAEEDAEPVLGPPGPRPPEPWSPTPIPKDAPGSQPPPEGGQEAGWGLASSDAPGEVEAEQEELGSGEFSEGLQDEGDDSRDESEADGLGETLPDSTPLGLYLRSPASPQWDLAGEQRPSPQGDSSKEGWGPAVLTSEAHGAHPEAEEDEEEAEEAEEAEERGDEDEEQGQDSDVLEEFEDLGTEASLLPGDPREVMGPLRQVSQLPLQPAAWGQDGESDGFADEEASGEEAEEGEQGAQEPGAGQWGLGFPVGGLPAPSGPQTGKLLGSETVDGGLRGAAAGPRVTVLETESQGSTEPSGSEEEPEAAPLEREAQVPGPLGTLGGTEGPPGVNGQGPSLKDELEHVNGGVANWLERSEGAGQGGRRSPLEGEKEGSALKAPWAGAPLHLGPSQFLQFSQREADADSWSSGED